MNDGDSSFARQTPSFPNGKEIRINARHMFKGNSMWNTAHGVAKAAQMGWKDHILTCGHTHVSGYQVIKDPASGLISHALQVASFKIINNDGLSVSSLIALKSSQTLVPSSNLTARDNLNFNSSSSARPSKVFVSNPIF